MLYRQAKILNNFTLPDVGAYTFDLNVRDPITALWFEFRATNGATDNLAALLPQIVSGIEVLDGSDVLYSLTGFEAFALTCAWLKHIPFGEYTEWPGDTQMAVFMIPFGRVLGDPAYAFNPTRFTNPQCRLTVNLAAVRAVGATGFVTGSLQVTVAADIMEGVSGLTGFLTHKTNYSFVSAAAGVTYVDLPTDHPYLAIMLRAYLAGAYMTANITNVKLQCDQNKYIPFDADVRDFWRYEKWGNPRYNLEQCYHLGDNETLVTMLKRSEKLALQAENRVDSVFTYQGVGLGQANLRVFEAGVAAAIKHNIYGLVNGYAPFGTIWIPLGAREDPADWFQARVFNSMRLELTNGGAGAACSVCTTQARPY